MAVAHTGYAEAALEWFDALVSGSEDAADQPFIDAIRAAIATSAHEPRDAWLVETNTDLTEGRGRTIPYRICEKEATAIRVAKKAYVQGTDAPVRPIKLLKVGHTWYGPVMIQPESVEDEVAQKRLDAKRALLAKARAAGFTDAEIAALSQP